MRLDSSAANGQPSFAAAFASALLDPTRATPVDVVGPRGKAAVKRYNVYRNNVTVSLIDALAGIYPAVQRITGVDFFRAMARFHIRATRPTSPLLFECGRDFPDFIESYEYAQDMLWLADIARIERAWLDAYHAADAPALHPDMLAGVPPNRLASWSLPRIRQHASCDLDIRRWRSLRGTASRVRSPRFSRAPPRMLSLLGRKWKWRCGSFRLEAPPS
jgi:hypothetical protein